MNWKEYINITSNIRCYFSFFQQPLGPTEFVLEEATELSSISLFPSSYVTFHSIIIVNMPWDENFHNWWIKESWVFVIVETKFDGERSDGLSGSEVCPLEWIWAIDPSTWSVPTSRAASPAPARGSGSAGSWPQWRYQTVMYSMTDLEWVGYYPKYVGSLCRTCEMWLADRCYQCYLM